MRNYPILILVLVGIAATLGCTTEQAKMSPEENPYLSQGRIQFESSTTKDIIHVVRVDINRPAGGLLKVIVTLRNRTKDNLWADIRTTFLDADNHVLESTNWEPILLSARTVTEYTCNSLSNQATDYQIIIRKPKKTSLSMP